MRKSFQYTLSGIKQKAVNFTHHSENFDEQIAKAKFPQFPLSANTEVNGETKMFSYMVLK